LKTFSEWLPLSEEEPIKRLCWIVVITLFVSAIDFNLNQTCPGLYPEDDISGKLELMTSKQPGKPRSFCTNFQILHFQINLNGNGNCLKVNILS